MPALPALPKAPLRELDAVSDTAAALALADRHIVDLHHYIIALRNTFNTAYRDYLERCHASSAGHP
ncbi:hypothetical protein [Paraburkholderia adhaesiva]|uniref:hypothetical protein n=1 Tax=Paraburkholderia adhaesiva TaxID=2883244 RepID=UPI001F17CC58|nr:hypothetical protein [Paraburkholderia adhaesiva]